ncbi:class I SAM-dependent methyltransferase [Methanolobus sp. WCC1]|uniref:class I SAM-dependent methyltransferase n=1 Tax=unclassified Methanolobus TaxID=2629569 RepID=UPI00324DCE23
MFDFYFGSEDEIERNESEFILFIKRMMPRWCNSIPDSECIALLDLLNTLPEKERPVLVETGTGASTIPLLYYAVKNNGVLYTWDTNQNKLAFIRNLCNDTIFNHFRKSIFDNWKYIGYESTSQYLGIPILKELNEHVDFCFFDSEHTSRNLLGELSAVNSVLDDGAIVAIDDANYNYIDTNFAYINIFRKKLGLPIIDSPQENIGKYFYESVYDYLKQHWNKVEHLKDTYKSNYTDDIFWSYYSSDRKAIASVGMEKTDELDHRFDSWKVSERLQ